MRPLERLRERNEADLLGGGTTTGSSPLDRARRRNEARDRARAGINPGLVDPTGDLFTGDDDAR